MSIGNPGGAPTAEMPPLITTPNKHRSDGADLLRCQLVCLPPCVPECQPLVI
ncbi:hypothetical protein JYU34_019523 [Plutella xylostella]|uniref:Uncharacterized protein n=1 Tax=Plutella xylostella TaxID=51655 RepID=A0ABQ7PYE6_PLUXY|nr:hypothetical protein JYU34_019523 [Plutella xylostella]